MRSGDCRDQRCEDGMFGPQCQYYDALVKWGVELPGFLNDYDSNTCGKVDKTYSVRVNRTQAFTFARIVFIAGYNAKTMESQISLKIGDQECKDRNVASGNVLDVYCNKEGKTIGSKEFIFSFPIQMHVCQILINAGNNIAFASAVVISSMKGSFWPQELVDGDYSDLTYNGGTCFTTNTENRPSINVTFGFSAEIYEIQIYNRVETNDQPRNKMAGNLIRLWDSEANKGPTLKISASPTSWKVSYTLNDDWNSSYAKVGLESGNKAVKSQLALCEILILGKRICPPKSYGYDCAKTCNCESGTCPQVAEACSEKDDEKKSATTINSTQKRANDKGTKDDANKCPQGKYGPSCNFTCHCNSTADCDKPKVICTSGCITGYQGPDCQESVSTNSDPDKEGGGKDGDNKGEGGNAEEPSDKQKEEEIFIRHIISFCAGIAFSLTVALCFFLFLKKRKASGGIDDADIGGDVDGDVNEKEDDGGTEDASKSSSAPLSDAPSTTSSK